MKKVMRMEGESNRNNVMNKIDSQDEVHHHYHMGGGPPGTMRTEQRPGEMHYHYYYEPPRHVKKRSSKPAIAGALLIINALIAIVIAGLLISVGWMFSSSDGSFEFFGMSETGDITGTVVYENGTPVEGATISIVGESLTTQTNENGGYTLSDVPTGNQKVIVEKDGYNTIIYKAFIEPSGSRWDPDNKTMESGNDFDFTLSEGNQTLERGSYPPWDLIMNFLYVCAALILIFAIITLIGGVYAIKRRHFGIALTGAILGVLTGGILALIALFILLIAKEEFNGQENPVQREGGYMA